MKKNPLFYKFRDTIKAASAQCRVKNIQLTLEHLNAAKEIAQNFDANKLEYDIDFWITSIKIAEYSRAITGMAHCLTVMKNFEVLLDQEEN